MKSLRGRLFLLLLTATGAIWLCAIAWIYVGSRAELQHVLDTRLQEAARMVHSLVASGNIADAMTAAPFEEAGYQRQLSCQIWSLDGRLVARSSGAPDSSLAESREGYADRTVGGETWRVFTIVDGVKGVRVAVGDRIGLRDRLVRDLVIGLIAPAALIAPLLGVLIWLSLGRGLRPLHAIAREIAARDGEDMSPIAGDHAPAEARPLVAALNGLLAKVGLARRHERDVTAFAAHELRTPLAGLRTQAQIALATTDETVRQAALRQILVSVDRTSRLARQLLALARLEATPVQRGSSINVGKALRDMVSANPAPAGIAVDIDPALDGQMIGGEAESLNLILRNLHQNAIDHMPAGGRIGWQALAGRAGLAITDEGPGIPQDELALVTQRFYRGRDRTAIGTGLGLTIAQIAAERLGARLELANRTDRAGLRCSLAWGEGAAAGGAGPSSIGPVSRP